MLPVGALVAAAAVVARQPMSPPKSAQADVRLRDGAASVDALVAAFFDALAAKDAKALRRLRVTEDEYTRFVIPGNVEPGEPAQEANEQTSGYFWGSLHGKSAAYEDDLLRRFGGKKLTVLERTDSGSHTYAAFTAFKRLRFQVREEDGSEVEVATGSVIGADGQFKFVSFIRD